MKRASDRLKSINLSMFFHTFVVYYLNESNTIIYSHTPQIEKLKQKINTQLYKCSRKKFLWIYNNNTKIKKTKTEK